MAESAVFDARLGASIGDARSRASSYGHSDSLTRLFLLVRDSAIIVEKTPFRFAPLKNRLRDASDIRTCT